MYQNYNYYPQQLQQSQQPILQQQPQQMQQLNYLRQSSSTGLKGRPVSSLEEARAMSIDFDGSIFFFPDLANKRIYTKQINPDGTASLNMYELKSIPVETPLSNSAGYITRDEFENVVSQIKNAMDEIQRANASVPAPAPAKEDLMQF